jgi:hypothetical protein
LSPLDKAVMDSFIAAAMRDEPGHECVRAALETWLERHPQVGAAEAAREVYGILARLHLVGPGDETVGAEAKARVLGTYRRARAIGLHPDSCLAKAVEAWLREQPEDDHVTAERRVGRLVEAARQEVM